MKIKDFKCKCGHNDFFFADKGSQKGIYCSYCGKWVKWADKNEQNLAMKQESQIRPKGYWIENAPEYQNIDPPYICSECGNMHLRKTNYCDQCGAKMESEVEE